MSEPKKKIVLIAKTIKFTLHSIVYGIELPDTFNFTNYFEGLVVTHPSIKNKDLVLKSNFISAESREVCFVPVNVTPQFYQSVLEKSIKNADEYKRELNDIYKIGDVLGYLLI